MFILQKYECWKHGEVQLTETLGRELVQYWAGGGK